MLKLNTAHSGQHWESEALLKRLFLCSDVMGVDEVSPSPRPQDGLQGPDTDFFDRDLSVFIWSSSSVYVSATAGLEIGTEPDLKQTRGKAAKLIFTVINQEQ